MSVRRWALWGALALVVVGVRLAPAGEWALLAAAAVCLVVALFDPGPGRSRFAALMAALLGVGPVAIALSALGGVYFAALMSAAVAYGFSEGPEPVAVLPRLPLGPSRLLIRLLALWIVAAAILVLSAPPSLGAVLLWGVAIIGLSALQAARLARIRVTAADTRLGVLAGMTAHDRFRVDISPPQPMRANLIGLAGAYVTPAHTLSVREGIEGIWQMPVRLGGSVSVCASMALWPANGLVMRRLTVKLATLQVTPRASYARWLAEAYILQSATVRSEGGIQTASPAHMSGREEYSHSLPYAVGDDLRDIDVKRSAKLRQLVVRHFVSGGGAPLVLACHETAVSAESLDARAYDMLTLARTAAENGMTTNLFSYDDQAVNVFKPDLSGVELVRAALECASRLQVGEVKRRVLRVAAAATVAGMTIPNPSEGMARLAEGMRRDHSPHPLGEGLTRALAGRVVPGLLVVLTDAGLDGDDLARAAADLKHRGVEVVWPHAGLEEHVQAGLQSQPRESGLGVAPPASMSLLYPG